MQGSDKPRHQATQESGTVALGCGCCFDSELGFPIAHCKQHDRRTKAVKVAAALQDLGNWLDEAAKEPPRREALRNAGAAAVKAARAMVGADDAE